jgi:hypothetical protein
MGLIQCAEHGDQVLSFVSPKIAKYITDKISIDFKIEKISLSIDKKTKSVHPIDDDFAQELRKKYNLPAGEIKITDDELSFEIFCLLKGVCEICERESRWQVGWASRVALATWLPVLRSNKRTRTKATKRAYRSSIRHCLRAINPLTNIFLRYPRAKSY